MITDFRIGETLRRFSPKPTAKIWLHFERACVYAVVFDGLVSTVWNLELHAETIVRVVEMIINLREH